MKNRTFIKDIVDATQSAPPGYSTQPTGKLDMSVKEQMPPRATVESSKLPESVRFFVNESLYFIDVKLSSHMVIGRKQSASDREVDIDLTAYDAYKLGVSHHHAIIQVMRDHIAIKDFNSTNGTYINGCALKPMYGYSLRQGDIIQLGKLRLKVHFPNL